MIDPRYRFWIESVMVSDDHTGIIIDWDQRKWYSVTGPETLLPDDGDEEVAVLKRYIDQLPPEVHTIEVDADGLLISTSSDPDEDPTYLLDYPRYSKATSLHGYPVFALEKLEELDRLSPGVDLMSFVDDRGVKANKVVFKYNIIPQRRDLNWNEMHLVKSLPRHENLVSFSHVIVAGDDARVVGFTTVYIAGGSLESNKNRTVKIKWLMQLTAVIDHLNLNLGIQHQDVSPRNLLIDPETEDLKLFDFDRAARTATPTFDPNRNDVKGVMYTVYELITHDTSLRAVPHQDQDPNAIMNMPEWPVKSQLDCNVDEFRTHLADWVKHRRELGEQGHAMPPSQMQSDPSIPPTTPYLSDYGDSGEEVYSDWVTQRRSDAVRFNRRMIEWERPPQATLAA